MKPRNVIVSLIIILFCNLSAYAFEGGRELNAPAPKAAYEMVNQAVDLIGNGQFENAVVLLKKAMVIAPNFPPPQAWYIRCKTYFMNQYDQVRSEYEDLMTKEPNNPVYPISFAIGQDVTHPLDAEVWYQKVVSIAPEWSWGHFAKAEQLSLHNNPEAALAEYTKAVEIDNNLERAYYAIISIRQRAGNFDEAIATAEKLTKNPLFGVDAMTTLWALQLKKEKESAESKANLKRELEGLAARSHDVRLLETVYAGFAEILNDPEQAKVIEAKIRRIDPKWYSQRWYTLKVSLMDFSEVNWQLLIGGHQIVLFNQITTIPRTASDQEKMIRAEKVLSLHPVPELRRFICQEIVKSAEKADDTAKLKEYGEELLRTDPSDAALLAKMAIVLAKNNVELDRALDYALRADRLTTENKPPVRSVNTDPSWLNRVWNLPQRDSVEMRRQRVRALALEAHGTVLSQKRDYAHAEDIFQQAVRAERTEGRLRGLAEIEEKLGKKEEADKFLVEAKNEAAESVKRELTSFKPAVAKEIELQSVDGRKVKLSELKGKVVLIDFWATWCHPCMAEMPSLIKLYEKYKDKGLEILFVSVDDKADRYKVEAYARDHKLEPSVLYDDGARAAYNVNSFPTNIFIDQEGKMRYLHSGYFDTVEWKFETIIKELLK